MVQSINKHIENNSAVAANRFLKKQDQCARYREFPIRNYYENFLNKKKISYSSFIKHIGKKYKKPHRFSDLCKYCEHNKVS